MYSRYVFFLKILFPVIGLFSISLLFVFPILPRTEDTLQYYDLDDIEVRQNQTFSEIQFSGLVGIDREIIIFADSGDISMEIESRVSARNINGFMDWSDTELFRISSDHGIFDMASQLIDLEQNIIFVSTSGWQLATESLSVAMGRIFLFSPGPVQITGPRLFLTANSMELVGPDGQGVLTFSGSVRVTFVPAR